MTILESGFYKIPRFQRPYSWEKENVTDFWSDLIGDEGEDYFIGSMVVYKDGSSIFGVVDGQQRLTTVTIMLSVLRDKVKILGEKGLADGMQRLIARPDIESKKQNIIQPETSYPYFQVKIQSYCSKEDLPDATQEEVAIKEAFEILDKAVEGYLSSKKKDEEKVELIKLIRDRLLNLKVIFIEMENEEDAYVIFETLNTRGKDLEIADLLKSHLTRNIKGEIKDVDRAKDKWVTITRNIDGAKGDIKIEDYIHHFWVSSISYIPKKKVYKDIKTKIHPKNANSYLDAFLSESEYYCAIYDPTFIAWDKQEVSIQDSLFAFVAFNIRQPIPLILSVLSSYKSKSLKLKKAKQFLDVIEKFHFFHTAITSQRSSGGLSRFYSVMAQSLRKAGGDTNKTEELLTELKEKLEKRLPNFSEFYLGFQTVKYTRKNSKRKKLVQYILRKLDNHMRGLTPIDYGLMTIEHVASESDQFASEFIGQIGNLIYVSSNDNNRKLKDRTFNDKVKFFRENYKHLDNTLLNESKWGPDQIKKRTKFLAKISYETIWKI